MADSTTERAKEIINKYLDTKEKKYVAIGVAGVVVGAILAK